MPAEATVTAPGEVHVTFDAPEFAVTPGQTAAVYAGDDVLVAGTIHEVGVGST
jgi:tRNA U34 2-thiouridine synthase MnmA/TrmU